MNWKWNEKDKRNLEQRTARGEGEEGGRDERELEREGGVLVLPVLVIDLISVGSLNILKPAPMTRRVTPSGIRVAYTNECSVFGNRFQHNINNRPVPMWT
jgi:hypothetical protein